MASMLVSVFTLLLIHMLTLSTMSYPYFVSYVGQIGPNWGNTYNAKLLSNLGVPGYSDHPYNVLNFAFWFSSTGAGAAAAATGCWENLNLYITDSTLRQTLTGSTNPSSAELRAAIKAIYVANNIKIFVSAFGATDHPQSAGYAATDIATDLASYTISYLYDGVDIDWEEGSYFNAAGAGEAWLSTLTTTLSNVLNPIQKLYYITHAPQAPYFMGSTLNQYVSGGYLTVHTNVGHLIDWYNVQFYNQGSSTYNTFANMFGISVGWSANSAVYQMINGHNPETVSIPANKIVVGKHSAGDGNDFVDGVTLQNIFNQALAANSPVWNTGFMCWQFYTENNQSPQFQLANEVVAADWDPDATSLPAATPAPVATTLTPTSYGGGSGCVDGNICVKVKGFALETPSVGAPVWWWAVYVDNIMNSLMSGCVVTDCTDVQVKQSHASEWVTGYTENGDCSFQMGDNPFLSSTVSVDFKITSSSNQVVQSNGVVLSTVAGIEWDFGSNFDSCLVTSNPAPATYAPIAPHATIHIATTQELECNDCDKDQNDIRIVVVFMLREWIIYDFSDIECWLYGIFMQWFITFEFNVCDIEVSVSGGERNVDGNRCYNGPCLWDKTKMYQRRLLLQSNHSGNASMTIITNNDAIYDEINTMSLDSMMTGFETQFKHRFNLQIDTKLQLFLEKHVDGHYLSGGMKIIAAIVFCVFVMAMISFFVFIYKWYKKKNKKADNATTEMIFAPTLKDKTTSFDTECDDAYTVKPADCNHIISAADDDDDDRFCIK